MHVEVVVVVVAVLGLGVAALSSSIDRLPVSEPLLAVVAGVLVGPQVLGWVVLPALGGGSHELREVAVVLLAVSMMAIALRYPIGDVRRRAGSVGLLLGVLMPVMALASAGVAWAVLGPTAGLGAAAALLLGVAVCPTDPVLSSSVVTGGPAERDIAERTRQLVVVAVAVAGPLTGGEAGLEVLRSVLGALALGVAAGWGAGRAVRLGEQHRDTSPAQAVLFTLVLALGVLSAAHLFDVGAVLAVFVTGLALNATWTSDDRVRALTIDEALNKYAVLPVFVLLGVALPWSAWAETGWALVLLVVGVLLLRRLPWLLALSPPLRLARRDALFLGWFGPIGVSAIYYLLEVGERVPGSDLVVTAGTAVVVGSTLVHGLTGSPGRAAYARAEGG